MPQNVFAALRTSERQFPTAHVLTNTHTMNSAVDYIQDDPNLMDHEDTQPIAAAPTASDSLFADATLQGDILDSAPPVHATQGHAFGQAMDGVEQDMQPETGDGTVGKCRGYLTWDSGCLLIISSRSRSAHVHRYCLVGLSLCFPFRLSMS